MACFVLSTAATAGSPGLSGNSTKNAADIAVIDRVLATVQPGQTTVKFGDCGMRVSDLQVFRARLVAEQSPLSSPTPYADTPEGTAFKWPNGIVYYEFDPTEVSNGTLTAAKMQMFRDSIGEWAGAANLTFTEFTGTPPTNYIDIQEAAGTEGGFSSSVGMAGGEQFIQIGPTSWNRGTICHEVGHALGYYHEQQRDDRDTYVIIDFNNIATSEQPNFTKLPGGSVAQGAYDFYSIMHYSRNALAINPAMDTITMQPAYAQYANIIGEVYDRTLSKLDRSGMAGVYGNPAILPSAVVTNTQDSGSGSLRAAIYYAFDRSTDSTPTKVSISFQIPKTDPNYNSSTGVFTIAPSYLMTSPGDGTTIDGTTEETFTGGDTNAKGPSIMLSGATQAQYETIGAGYEPAMILRQSNCVVKALVINGYDVQGLQMMGATTTGNVVSGCYIGTDATGTKAVPNAFSAIEIYGGANGNTIGGTTTAARNILSGNTYQGIYLHDTGTINNVIEGNYIGLNALGTAALPNTSDGIDFANGAQTNTIGGTTTTARNVISGNSASGIGISGAGTSGNLVLGNYIGVNVAGTAAIGNGFASTVNNSYFPGVDIYGGAQSNVIGGTATGTPNVISGNAGGGVDISGTGTNENLVEGNAIGTNTAGTAALGNGIANPTAYYLFAGVQLFGGAQSNVIGGTVAAAKNIISGNGSQGVNIGNLGTSFNLVEGNFIGTNRAGTAALANGYSGIGIFNSASSNTIGGTATGSLNLISGNTDQGIAIGAPDSGQTVGPTQNIVEGNYIGVNLAGTAALPNGTAGVDLLNASQSNIIGGSGTAARNVISGNGYQDVAISDPGSTGNMVLGNYIGLDKSGTTAIANNNSGLGLFNGAQSNVIGGVVAGARNYISGHASYGLFIENAGTNLNVVEGNTIGLNASSAAVANGAEGIAIFDQAQSNMIGGTAAGAGNIVSGNTDEGVALYNYTSPTSVIDNSISENSIYGNSAGIYLYNNANNNQAAPTLSSAIAGTSTNPSGTDVTGTLTSAVNTKYRVEFFSSPSGNEGQTFLGAANVTTTSAGSATFTAPLTVGVMSGFVVTATATDPAGNTSQFSAPQTVTAGMGGPKSQTITFPAIANTTYAKVPITLEATATSGLAVTYTIVSGPATVSGNMLTITGVGSITVQANQAGNSSYSAAPAVNQSFTVSKARQTITFPAIGNQNVGAPPITLMATASSGLAVTYTVVSGPATVSGSTLTVTGAGTVMVKATQAGNVDYTAATAVTQSFTVSQSSQASQTITFPTIPTTTYGMTVTLNATASSGLAVSYSVTSGPATVSGNTVTLTGVGSVTIQATQAGNASYLAAPPVSQSFTVNQAAQTITFPGAGTQTVGGKLKLTATASSGLAVTYTLVSGPAKLANGILSFTAAGSAVVTANQAGNADYNAASPVNQTFHASSGG